MFIDIKKTVWERAYLNDDITREEAIEMVKNGGPLDYDAIYDWENLGDTDEYMTPEENGGQCTIELWDKKGDSKPIIDNAYSAKLVTCSITTQVLVPKDATEEQIIEAARKGIMSKIETDLHENISSIEED